MLNRLPDVAACFPGLSTSKRSRSLPRRRKTLQLGAQAPRYAECRQLLSGVCFLALLCGSAVSLSAVSVSAASAVDSITSLEASPSFAVRHHALHKMSAGELEAGVTQLIDFMEAQQVPSGMHPVDYMSLVNDSFNLLAKHDLRVEELLQLILLVIPDAAADEVWRDYAVQKLGYTLDRSDISEATLAAGFAMLERAAGGEFPRVQGTALLVALKLSDAFGDRHPFLKRPAIGEVALKTAKDENALIMERVTALQVAGLCGEGEALVYARSLLSADNLPISQTMLRVSGIAALGELGGSPDKSLLQQFLLSSDIRLRNASRIAIEKIEARL